MLKKLIVLALPVFLLFSCEGSLKTYNWVKEQMSFLKIKYPYKTFIREVNYSHNKVKTHGQVIKSSEEGALVFEGFKLNYELVQQKRLNEEVFDRTYLHKFLDSLRIFKDGYANGYHKTIYFDVHGKEHDYIAHFTSKSSPIEVLLTVKCFKKEDYKIVEEMLLTSEINETILNNVSNNYTSNQKKS